MYVGAPKEIDVHQQRVELVHVTANILVSVRKRSAVFIGGVEGLRKTSEEFRHGEVDLPVSPVDCRIHQDRGDETECLVTYEGEGIKQMSFGNFSKGTTARVPSSVAEPLRKDKEWTVEDV